VWWTVCWSKKVGRRGYEGKKKKAIGLEGFDFKEKRRRKERVDLGIL